MADVKISDSIVYIGVDDKDIDLFESQYEVPNGVSYNSYLILDEKIAVMDTADMRVSDKWFENLEKALNGAVPDYLIVSHLEPDHAGNIKKAADKYPEMKIVVNSKSETMLPQFFEISADRLLIVKEGDELSLWRLWCTGLRLWLNMKSQKKYFSPPMVSVSSVLWIQTRTGHAKREDIISI